jgi:HrpA-like RNA helicase
MSHLILDEVHERDVNTDFSLTLLRGLLASKQYPDLRLILMSATASADFFVNYFASATTVPPASLEIPGRTFPVSIHWLSACECTAGMTLWDGGGGGGASGSTPNVNDNSNQMMLSPRAHQKIDNKLLRALITKIIEKQQIEGELKVAVDSANKYRETGAILVFLPGKAEIESLARCLYEDRERVTGDRNLCQILKLYSSMPRIEQQTVFRPALHGTVKIVLATNVAE